MRLLARVALLGCSVALVGATVALGVSAPDRAIPSAAGAEVRLEFVAQRATHSNRHAQRPAWRSRLIPYGAKRKREMAAYSQRHYGERTWRLRRPRVIVEHMAQAPTAASVFNVFAPDHPDPELGELPNVCTHFVVDGRGRIHRLVNLRTRCRHTVGLNWTAIGIEHTGYGDGDVLGDRRQLRASLRLSRYLRCRFRIRVRDVIGHRESLRSPYHRERVRSLRTQTHGDWRHASMRVYRGKLRRMAPC